MLMGLSSPHDGTDISCQVPATGGGGEILLRVEAVRVNHEVAVGQVSVKSHKRIRKTQKDSLQVNSNMSYKS